MSNLSTRFPAIVNRLLKATKVNVKSYSELCDKEAKLLDELNNPRGFYHHTGDYIALNEKNRNITETALHELIHWSGHSKRLKRANFDEFLVFVGNEKVTTHKTLEEAVAQIGMLKLVLALGMNPAGYDESTLKYLENLDYFDLKKADIQSSKAVEYLLSFLQNDKVKSKTAKSEFLDL